MTELKNRGDPFKGVTVRLPKSPSLDVTTFSHNLAYSLQLWTQTHRRGVWFIIPITQSHVIASLAQTGIALYESAFFDIYLKTH
jgi:hypothetical protein